MSARISGMICLQPFFREVENKSFVAYMDLTVAMYFGFLLAKIRLTAHAE